MRGPDEIQTCPSCHGDRGQVWAAAPTFRAHGFHSPATGKSYHVARGEDFRQGFTACGTCHGAGWVVIPAGAA